MRDGSFTADHLLALYDRVAEAEDAIPRLRRFVLDLAVRGKLVEQDPSDEPAAELLKRIAKEKERLETAGQVRRSTDVAPSSTSLTFSAPSGWVWTQLQRLARARMGKTILSGELVTAGLPVFSAGMENRPWGYLEASDVVFRRGTVVISARGGIGFPKIPEFDEFVSTQTTIACECFDPALATYICMSLDALVDWKGITSQTAIPMITVKQIHSLEVPLPPLAEQQRIVAKVDELMALCDRLQAARAGREAVRDRLTAATLTRLSAPETDAETFPTHAHFALQTLPTLTTRPDQIKTLRQTILNLAVRGKLVAQDAADEPAAELLGRIREWQKASISRKKIRAPRKPLAKVGEDDQPYPLPEGWIFARLGELIYIQSGDGLTAANMKEGTYPVFGGNGINGHHDCHNVQKPTLVIGRVGYYCGSVHVTPENAWVTDNAFITHFSEEEILLSFLVLLLNGTNLKEDENATAQPVISGSKIYPIVVGLPPLAEQHRIVAKVDALMALCDQLEASLTTATTTRAHLLEALLHEALAPAAPSAGRRETEAAV